MSVERASRIALLLQQFGDGGVERCFINLARGFANCSVASDLYVVSRHEHAPRSLAGGVNMAYLQPGSIRDRARQLGALLDAAAPTALLAAKDEDYKLALAARTYARAPFSVVFVASLNYTAQLAGRRANPWRRWWRYRQLRSLYGGADRVFCVSQGVAADMARILRCDASALPVLPNPVITPEASALSRQAIPHPWFGGGQPPIVLGVGRLSRIKNFSLLVRAFARARDAMPMRLVILGEGKQRAELERLAAKLGIADDVSLPGYVENPYPYMRQASLFVLSSLWEGFGNVLVEALFCGTPVVATDCPSGPAEILDNGRYGPLVPINDEVGLAEAMVQCLRAPPNEATFREATRAYTLENSTRAYLHALGLPCIEAR